MSGPRQPTRRSPVRRWVGLTAVLALAVLNGCGGDQPTSRAESEVAAQSRGTVEHVDQKQSSFGEYGDYSIYLPAGYDDAPDRRFPVVYLLHGATEDDTFFLQLGLRRVADRLTADGRIEPMILVLADGGPSFTGSGSTAVPFDEFFARELVPAVDARWRTVPERDGRAVGGISLGGLRALNIAAASPQLTGAAAGHSAAVRSGDVDRLAVELAGADVDVSLDIGEDDYLRPGNEALARASEARGSPIGLKLGEGGHTREYWSTHLPEYLEFYSGTFAR